MGGEMDVELSMSMDINIFKFIAYHLSIIMKTDWEANNNNIFLLKSNYSCASCYYTQTFFYTTQQKVRLPVFFFSLVHLFHPVYTCNVLSAIEPQCSIVSPKNQWFISCLCYYKVMFTSCCNKFIMWSWVFANKHHS